MAVEPPVRGFRRALRQLRLCLPGREHAPRRCRQRDGGARYKAKVPPRPPVPPPRGGRRLVRSCSRPSGEHTWRSPSVRSTSAAPAVRAAVTVANIPAAGGGCKHGTGHGGGRLPPAETAGESSAASPVPQADTQTPKDTRTQSQVGDSADASQGRSHLCPLCERHLRQPAPCSCALESFERKEKESEKKRKKKLEKRK